MSAPDLAMDLMEQFRESGAQQHSTILLGAGASTTSGLPDWDTFATRLLIQSGSVATADTARLLLSRQDPLLVAEAARVALGDRWTQKLRTALYQGVDSMDASPLHLAAVGHLLSGDGTDTSLVTLNFDTLLELAIQTETGFQAVSSVDGRAGSDGHTVYHLHGVITPERSDGVVLTLTDFTDLIARSDSWQAQYLQLAVTSGALIIAGTSYRDPDVRQWLRLALQQKPVQHAALVLLARQGFSLSKAEFALVKRALSDQWQAVGLKPVLLQDHSDAAQIIRELRYVQHNGYLSPQQRSVQVWTAHTDRFDELQTAYADQLETDAVALQDALDVDRLNLTLWLANGAGKLVRWAAQDRVYRDASALRAVDSGHDSQWIAGQALGADALLFQDLKEGSTRQWRSVLALPVPVPHPTLPSWSTAVLTVGLPDLADRFAGSRIMWGDRLARIADRWGTTLSAAAFAG